MKTSRYWILLAGLVLARGLSAAPSPAAASRVEVVFDHPEKFRDVRDSFNPTDRGRDSILENIRHALIAAGKYYVPEGYNLKIVFTDIKLAGDYEPWHGPDFDDIRIVKAIYPPSFTFTYTVSDPSGHIIKQGSENFTDMNFQMRLVLDSGDSLRYEKDILRDWMSSTLRDLRR